MSDSAGSTRRHGGCAAEAVPTGAVAGVGVPNAGMAAALSSDPAVVEADANPVAVGASSLAVGEEAR